MLQTIGLKATLPQAWFLTNYAAYFFPPKKLLKVFKKTTICREISKHVTLIEVQSMVLSQSHTKTGAVECKSNKLLNTELIGQDSIKRAVCSSLCQTTCTWQFNKYPNIFLYLDQHFTKTHQSLTFWYPCVIETFSHGIKKYKNEQLSTN